MDPECLHCDIIKSRLLYISLTDDGRQNLKISAIKKRYRWRVSSSILYLPYVITDPLKYFRCIYEILRYQSIVDCLYQYIKYSFIHDVGNKCIHQMIYRISQLLIHTYIIHDLSTLSNCSQRQGRAPFYCRF